MKSIEEIIKSKKFKNLYVLFGEEDYLRYQYQNKLINSILDEGAKNMNLNIFEGSSFSVLKLEEVSETLPFFSEYRVILVKDTKIFSDGKKIELENLEVYLKKLPKTTIVIFSEEKADKRLKIFKSIKSIGEIFEFNKLKESEALSWILNKFKEHNKKIANATCISLIRNVGLDLNIISNEILKIVSFKGNEEEVTLEDINQICSKNEESKIFDLIASIGSKNLDNSILIYKNLIFNKIYPFMILNMIARQFRIMIQVKYLNKIGEGVSSISSTLNLREFVVREAIVQSKNFSNKVLLEGINDCLEADYSVKTGKMQDELAVELLIVKYASL